MAATKRPLVLLVLLFSVLVFASACGASNDPETWAQAEEDDNLRPNFMRACTEANQDGGDLDFDAAQARAYCECAFVEIVQYYGGEFNDEGAISDVADAVQGRDFEAFKAFESGLRDDPEDIPADIEAFLNGCVGQAAP